MRINSRTLTWLLWASTLFLVMITPRTSSDGLVGGSFRYILWTDFIFGIVVLIMVARCDLRIFQIRAWFKMSKIQVAFLLLFLFNYLSIFISVLGSGDSMITYVFSGWFWIQAALTFIVAGHMVCTEKRVIWTRRIFIAGYCIVAVIGLLELARVPVVVDFLDSHYGTETHVGAAQYLATIGQFRLTSTFDRNPHGLALCTMMMIPWMAVFLAKGKQRLRSKLVAIILICVGLVLLIGTTSALGIAATAVAIMSVVLSNRKNRCAKTLVLMGLLMVGGYVVQAHLSGNALEKFVGLYRMFSAYEQGPSSYISRLDVWSRILQLICESPSRFLFGIPYAEGGKAYYGQRLNADSDYMFMLLYGGILGLGVFLFLYWRILTNVNSALKVLHDENSERYILLVSARGILLGMMVAGVAGGFMTGSGTAWRTSFTAYTLIGASLGGRLIRNKE